MNHRHTDNGVPDSPGRSLLGAGVLLIGFLSGCATHPLPQPPDTTAASQPFRQAPPASVETRDGSDWQGFGDPVLESLMARARAANLDVRVALQRLRQARSGSVETASRRWPSLSVTGSWSDESTGLPERVKEGSPDTRAVRGALELRWELDVSGAASAAADAAQRDALAAEAGVETAQWLAATEVAQHYIVWQGARLRLRQLDALLQKQQQTGQLTRNRQALGLASALDTERSEAEIWDLSAQLPALRTLVAVSEHRIDVLLGTGSPPGSPPWQATASEPALPNVPVLAPGQPVELLLRRPDLRVAEQRLLAEAARLREAQADLLPRLFLSAVLGRQDLRLNALDLSPARYSNLALAFAAPLFNAGRLRAAVERQSAGERVATLQYEAAVLTALQQVENSLAAQTQERERGVALAAAVETRRRSLRLAESLHREGQINLLQLLEAQRGHIAAELAFTDHRTQSALNAIQLVKALGGGWAVASGALTPSGHPRPTPPQYPPFFPTALSSPDPAISH